MGYVRGGKSTSRVILAAALAILTVGATAMAVAEPAGSQAIPGPAIMAVAEVSPAPDGPARMGLQPPAVVEQVPAPADVVQQTGSWFAHGYTLDLRDDGTGTFAVWLGAFNGNRMQLRLIPAPGAATVAEILAVDTIGQGALAPDALPGVGGLVTISFGDAVRTAHVEWTSGAERQAADLCPAAGLDAAALEALHCGA